jgi:hypothetical protein
MEHGCAREHHVDDERVVHLGCDLATVTETEFGTVDLRLRVDILPSGAKSAATAGNSSHTVRSRTVRRPVTLSPLVIEVTRSISKTMSEKRSPAEKSSPRECASRVFIFVLIDAPLTTKRPVTPTPAATVALPVTSLNIPFIGTMPSPP